jgi:nicotinate-nucleotide adenylyltransferase
MNAPKHKLGIMGGTFDPIHIGHLVTAEAVRNEFQLEKVIFIPAGNPPHKQGSQVTNSWHRYVMTVMATYSNPYFSVSPIELERQGPSYTIDTVKALLNDYGQQTEFYFIIGADTVCELHTWRHINDLFKLCQFVAATRPGSRCSVDQVIDHFGTNGQNRIQRLATPELEISSTDIREKVRSGRSIKYIVPESVEMYIKKEGLYLRNSEIS